MEKQIKVEINGEDEVFAGIESLEQLKNAYTGIEGAKILPIGRKTLGGHRHSMTGIIWSAKIPGYSGRWWNIGKMVVA